MPDLVTVTNDFEIAVVTINNPPLNVLNQLVRNALRDRLEQVLSQNSVRAVVVTCDGRTFISGSDIREFDQARVEPKTATLAAMLEASAKPTIAALFGSVLGGGLEIALGCHWRIAAVDACLGLPEVKLGLCPGAGGSQRLPRAVGIDRALDMITSGETVRGREALTIGLIDAITLDDPRSAAIAFARRLLAKNRPPRRLSEITVPGCPPDFASWRRKVQECQKGLDAPLKVIDAVEASLLPFPTGMKIESDTFAVLQDSAQSRALRYVFFAERETRKIPELSDEIAPRTISSAAVIGAGTMGTGIAASFANAGIPVTLIESDPAALKNGVVTVMRNLDSVGKRQNLTPDAIAERAALISTAATVGAAVDCDIVVEAVFEDLNLKREIFRELDRTARPGAILATNTSYQDIAAIAAATNRPRDVLGLHFFSPAHIMRLVEVARTAMTSVQTLATAIALVRRIKKLPVVVNAVPGFVGNRLLYERARAAERLLYEGASPAQIDGAMVVFGFPMGPFAAADLAGLDVSWRARRAAGQRLPIADALASSGRFGQKTSAGYYRYVPGSRIPEPDSEADRVIDRVRSELGIRGRSDITEAEIVERLLYPMVNEGARLLKTKIAIRPSDIDIVCVYGYGFPRHRGGPMHYADEVGLQNVREALIHMARDFDDPTLVPAELIETRISEGRGFLSS